MKLLSVSTAALLTLLFSACSLSGDMEKLWQEIRGSQSYTVSFDSDGGSEVASQNVKPGDKAEQPSNPVKAGYIFVDWYTNKTYDTLWNFANAVTGNMTLYARWADKDAFHVVYFEANDGKGTLIPPKVVAVNDLILEPEIVLTKAGHDFIGWYTHGTDFSPANKWDFAETIDVGIETLILYAGWEIWRYNVVFVGNGAPNPPVQTVNYGDRISEPDISRTGFTLDGWYTDGTFSNKWNFASAVTLPKTAQPTLITLYAKWNADTEAEGATLAAKLQWLQEYAQSNTVYFIDVVNPSEDIAPQILFDDGRSNIKLHLRNQSATERIVNLSTDGSLFTVNSGVTLYLEGQITFMGINDGNSASLLRVNPGASLEMKAGVKITGNRSTTSSGGGVYVNGGSFIMDDGEIYGNTGSDGAGVYINSGSFTMDGGEISGNTGFRGCGVYVNGGTFTLAGGEISGNTMISSGNGGGVYVTNSGNFTMSGGEISGNTGSYGGGVYVTGGSFTMNSGEISDNTADSYGGGVYVTNSGNFTMDGGEISGNTGSSGGGVSVGIGTFTMSGGEISGNTADSYGGGVFLGGNGGSFTMSGGEISGNTGSNGAGVYAFGGSFTMDGGEISGNIADTNGGGVYVNWNTNFTMDGGEISGNTASAGGGVYVSGHFLSSMSGGSFIMNGGEISGNTADTSGGGVYMGDGGTLFKEGSLALPGGIIGVNTVSAGSGMGSEVYVDSDPVKRRETIVPATERLDSSTNDGWE